MPEGDEDPPGRDTPRKTAKKKDLQTNAAVDEAFYKPYVNVGYKRIFPENSRDSEYTVFVENDKGEKIGNNNPLMMANLFKNEIKGVI